MHAYNNYIRCAYFIIVYIFEVLSTDFFKIEEEQAAGCDKSFLTIC